MTYNNKSIGPIISFLVWLFLLGIVCIVGITNVFAATYSISMTTEVAFYDNSGSSLTSIGTNWQESMQAYYSNNLPTTAGSYGGAIAFNSPIPLLANHTYALTLTFDNDDIDIALSLKNKIAIGNSISSVKYNYEQGNYYNELVYSNVANKSTLQFSFKTASNGNASYILIPWTTKTNMNKVYYFNQIIIDDLGTTSVTQDQINSSLNNQTNEINNSISNSENNIKGAIKDTEDNIKDGIKEGFETCRDSYNLSSLDNYTVNFTNSYYIDKLLLNNFENNMTYTLSFDITSNVEPFIVSIGLGDTYYRKDIPNATFFGNKNGHLSFSFTVNDSSYLNLWIRIPRYSSLSNVSANVSNIMLVKGNVEKPYEEYGKQVCKNRIDDTNDKLDDVNKSLNDDNIDSSSAGSFFDSFTSTDHGGISGIITAPLVAIKKMLDKSCSPLSATYQGQKIELPCGYDFWSKMTAIKEFINLTLGGILCYNIIRKLYKLIENMKNPDDDRVEVMKL